MSRDDQTKTPSSPDHDSRLVLDAIRRIVQMLRKSAQASEKRVGLSPAQLFVLHKLADGKPLSIGDLSQRTLTSQSSVSEVVQKLVLAGMVQRVRSARDARSVELSLTESGKAILRDAPAAPQDYLLAGLRRMPAEEQRQLAVLLGRLVQETGMVDVPARMLFDDERVRTPAPGEVVNEVGEEE